MKDIAEGHPKGPSTPFLLRLPSDVSASNSSGGCPIIGDMCCCLPSCDSQTRVATEATRPHELPGEGGSACAQLHMQGSLRVNLHRA